MRGINLKLPFNDPNYEKPSKKTDQLVDQIYLSFSLDQDPAPDSKTSTNMLRSFSAIGYDTSDHKIPLDHYLKQEEDIKEKNNLIKDLQIANTELKHLIKQLQEEKDEIVNVNIKLTKELENTIEKYEKLTVTTKKLKLSSPKSLYKDISKYAAFISQKCKVLPEIRVYFQDRLEGKDLINLVDQHREKALLITLQVISDIIVHNTPETRATYQPRTIIQENEHLMHSISEHNLRMARLNREIAKNAVPESLKRKPENSNTSSPYYES